MSEIFHSEQIISALSKELETVYKDLTIVSAFVKTDALKFIDSLLKADIPNKKLLVRFRLEDLLSESTDFNLYEYCQVNNWDLYLNFDLHSKIIIFDYERFMLGSANVTLSGLGLAKKSNIESMFCGKLLFSENEKINLFFEESIKANDRIISKMKEQLLKINQDSGVQKRVWNEEIDSFFQRKVELLWTSEMFFSQSPFDMYSRDMLLLGLQRSQLGDSELIKAKFRNSKSYRWLKYTVTSELYFGQLTERLHSSLIDNPVPYRKDVKQLLSNLLNWIEELKIEEFVIDCPNYSQRVKRIIL